MRRESRLIVYFTDDEHDRVRAAAQAVKRSESDFGRFTLLERAEEILGGDLDTQGDNGASATR